MSPALDSSAVWLVTGSSAGLGESFSKQIYSIGHNIVATARNVNSLSYLPNNDPRVLKFSLDVTSQKSISAAIDATIKRFGRLDVLINNAGYGSMGEAEGFPEDEARTQFETNFWGPVRLTQECIRVFREVNRPGQGGTIIQVSSMGGYLGYEGNSFYHATYEQP
jgi:NAD(P)-dependent dehydrogenase (short-subunit alcohol dehydrogenase family)